MERNKKHTKKVTAILTGDWHLREDHPVCRTDDYWTAQWEKVDYIAKLQKIHDCAVIHSGDLCHTWKVSPYLLSMIIEHLPKQFFTIYGNHDLPQHNLELFYKSSVYTLQKAGVLYVLKGNHWNTTEPSYIDYIDLHMYGLKMLVWHMMVWQGKRPWEGCTAPRSIKVLRQFPEARLILTGHNHVPFTEEHEGRLLVNPGSIFRQDADQIDYKPAVWLYYAETNTVERHYLPIKEDAVTREHIEKVNERDNRISAFVETLNTEWNASLSFEDNVRRYLEENKVKKQTESIIIKSLE